ncbi:MAG: NAD+ synthase [Candidatus Bathyarchaeota archaeon]|nr:NAD+ synthase [Candidatus Bathyarchaeota archaeon]
MKIAMAQINSTVGDIKGNVKKIKTYIEVAKRYSVDIVIFPELAVTGYPPQDLLHEREFVKENKRMLLATIGEMKEDIVGIVGFVDYKDRDLYNAAAIFKGNNLVAVAYKTLLPTYDVFDEARYFKPSKEINPVRVSFSEEEIALGIEICEDLWDEEYPIKVTDVLAAKGANIIFNLSASPFYVGKRFVRMRLLQEKAKKSSLPIFYVNMVGGQDELVFDGQSLAVDGNGDLIAIGRQFEEDLVITDIDLRNGTAKKVEPPPYSREEEMFNAVVLGIRDYFRKTGFKKAIVGMSGGIDSSLTACIAVEALGRENVIGVFMPSKYSSQHSEEDARRVAENLGILFIEIPIQEIMESYRRILEKPLEEIRKNFGLAKGSDDPVADENIQPRIRGNILMDISNRLKDLKILVINTGNKTELALGYCTLYGDMVGGIGALGDVSKLEVYQLARYVNEKARREIVPMRIFKKKPSPELREGQYDPFDFDIVSPMVDDIVERRKSKRELIEMGYPREVVEDIYRRFRRAEYKRRQAPPCVKITPKSFGIGWKMPIVNQWER